VATSTPGDATTDSFGVQFCDGHLGADKLNVVIR
jgi:hypothetical protein